MREQVCKTYPLIVFVNLAQFCQCSVRMARVVPLSAFLKVEFTVAFKRVHGDVFAGCNIIRLAGVLEKRRSYF